MTAITLTRAEVEALKPCSLDRLDVFEGRDRLNAREALEAGASVSDLLWVAGRLGLKWEIVRFAVACVERVAHLNPDPRVTAALDAAQAWVDDPREDKRTAAKTAADHACDAYLDGGGAAAYAAARAAYAAARAAQAAARAAQATYAAASGADAAADYAAYAAARAAQAAEAADAAEREAQRDIFLAIFCPEDGQ